MLLRSCYIPASWLRDIFSRGCHGNGVHIMYISVIANGGSDVVLYKALNRL